MRPEILFPLFADISTLAGVGPKTKLLFKKLVGEKIVNLIYHLPNSVVDRRVMPSVPDMQEGKVATTIVQIEDYMPPARPRDKKSPFKIRCYNETGFVTLVFFNAFPDYLKRQLPVGQKRVVSGRVERFGGEVQITHPDYIEPVSNLNMVKKLEPVYPLTAGIARKNLVKIITDALTRVKPLPEWIDNGFLKKHKWQPWHISILKLHHPEEESDIATTGKYITRLAYDELLANQLALALVRKFVNKTTGQVNDGNGVLQKELLAKLPFELTNGQKQVISEIYEDMKSPDRMMRLLQGDVGSGKTVVALFAALNAVESGKQVAIMAPTEILARQHYAWISAILENIDCKVEILIGKIKGEQRKRILKELENGDIDIIIGTHALFQESVDFANMGLAIIDEQHRFGVEQRMQLAKKGSNADVLLMTATPIPRTLTLTMYGDMECSRLTDKPIGRKEIDTRIVPSSRMEDVVQGMWRVIDRGEKVYWICPLIEESEASDLAAAQERHKVLNKIFQGRVGLVHSRIKSDEREHVMKEFRDGDIDILVATTVVEVGVDIPDATVIVIEHAERFGLSQLHQLRGRVGRNDKQSSCVLLYHGLGEIAKERLKIMRESNDGFRLAEEDLKLRGGGDVLGTKQSGMPDFKVANLYDHLELLKAAHDDARAIMQNDPYLKSPRGKALRVLLYLFGYDGQVKYTGV